MPSEVLAADRPFSNDQGFSRRRQRVLDPLRPKLKQLGDDAGNRRTIVTAPSWTKKIGYGGLPFAQNISRLGLRNSRFAQKKSR
jgi:hypothetical protein